MDEIKIEGKRNTVTAIVIVVCLCIVIFWEIIAAVSRKPFEQFEITADDFENFMPRSEEWEAKKFPVGSDPSEPNILAFILTSKTDRFSVKTRLVHGYNMRDCMRLKGYSVELLRGIASDKPAELPNDQVWRLISKGGDVSLWFTSLLKADNFQKINRDIRTLPFPRIAAPEDSMWELKGITKESLRHPLKSFKSFLRAKWNNSRCDIWVFLGLKQAPWASSEVLTLVTYADIGESDEKRVLARTAIAHDFMYSQLLMYWEKVGKISEP